MIRICGKPILEHQIENLKAYGLTDITLVIGHLGNVIIDVDFNRFIRFHKEHDAWASLISHPNGHPYDSSLLVTETLPPAEKGGLPVDTHRVIRWMNKEEERTYYQNRVNAGIEIISPQLLHCVEDERRESRE